MIKKIAYCFAISIEKIAELIKIIVAIAVRMGFHTMFLK
tara:strand:- start:1209 stop:1325 length:117 start_codon:yes stop_codon:yes gene_type:complete